MNVVLTGGVASQPVRAAAARVFPEARFHNVYGSTEVNDCLIETLTAKDFARLESLPLGTPIVGCEICLDTEGDRESLHGADDAAQGEVLVRTPWMAKGYIAEGALVPLPTTEDGLHRMRDKALWSNGQLTYLGRRDRVVKVRGQRVDLDEIENAARKTSLVGMSCAWLENSDTSAALHLAYSTLEHRSDLTGLELRMAMSEHLPAFAMPNRLHAFAEPFPLNGNGKTDINKIKAQVEGE